MLASVGDFDFRGGCIRDCLGYFVIKDSEVCELCLTLSQTEKGVRLATTETGGLKGPVRDKGQGAFKAAPG